MRLAHSAGSIVRRILVLPWICWELRGVVPAPSIKLVGPEHFGAAGENELHVPSETVGRFRHMLFTWN